MNGCSMHVFFACRRMFTTVAMERRLQEGGQGGVPDTSMLLLAVGVFRV